MQIGFAGSDQIALAEDMFGGQYLFGMPYGAGPFPAVIYHPGRGVDRIKNIIGNPYMHRLARICYGLLSYGFCAVVPLRTGAGEEWSACHEWRAENALFFVRENLCDIDMGRIAIAGMSRGAQLAVLSAAGRDGIKALVLMAPAGGPEKAVDAVLEALPRVNAPIQLLIDRADEEKNHICFKRLIVRCGQLEKRYESIEYQTGGGHNMFKDLGPYWKDYMAFLGRNIAVSDSR